MKRLKKGTKRHAGAYQFNTMPAYHSDGKGEYIRHLPPLRDHRIIDLQILSEVLAGMELSLDIDSLAWIATGLCEAGKSRFRYVDLTDFLKQLKQNGFFDYNDETIKIVAFRYNKGFQNAKRINK